LCPPAQSASYEIPDSDKLKGRGFFGHFRSQLKRAEFAILQFANHPENKNEHQDTPKCRAVEHRTSQFQIAGNRNATHPVNAILNYAYAVLQSRIQIDAVAEGYDPAIGIMHEKRAGSSAFIFDLMVPERPAVYRKVLEFIKGHVFDPADLVIRSDGVCRLNPEMARCLAGVVSGARAGRLAPISE